MMLKETGRTAKPTFAARRIPTGDLCDPLGYVQIHSWSQQGRMCVESVAMCINLSGRFEHVVAHVGS
jgi:hypothetical protein